MRKLFLLTLMGLVFAFPLALQAGIYGGLEGKITDENGRPLPGASIYIKAASKGCNSKPDGTYAITNISPGTYDVEISFTGKEKVTKKVIIKVDLMTTLNVQMGSKDIIQDKITVVGERLVENKDIGAQDRMSLEKSKSQVGTSITAMIGKAAGVQTTSGGVRIRGDRSSDTQIKIDGLDIADQFVGGYGGAGSSYFPMVSAFATEEVQVLKGGFSAEYGEALGGVVNTVMRTGKFDKYEGNIAYNTSAGFLYGSQEKDLSLYIHPYGLTYERSGEGNQLQGPGRHTVEFAVGGPFYSGLNNLSFFVSGYSRYVANRSASYEIYDAGGNNLGLLDNTRAWVKNISGRILYLPMQDLRIIIGGIYGTSSYESNSWTWLYAQDEGLLFDDNLRPILDNNGQQMTNGISENLAKIPVRNSSMYQVMARLNYTFTDISFMELTFSMQGNKDEFAKRVGYEDPNFLTGFELLYPEDNYQINSDVIDRGVDLQLDQYQPLTKERLSNDGYFTTTFEEVNPLTGYYEGSGDATGSNNPYGRSGAFYTHGNSGGVSYRDGSYWQLDGSYSLMLKPADENKNEEISHDIKTGFLFRYNTMHFHTNSDPANSGFPSYDIYTDQWGGNIYADNSDISKLTSAPFNPMKFEAYIQDQMEFRGIILSAGVRFDMFMPESRARKEVNTGFASIEDYEDPTKFEDAENKYQFSPRINITYPLTESSNISINYGTTFKTPQLAQIYGKVNTTEISKGSSVGNPNVDPQKTQQYQIQYVNGLTKWLRLTVTAYYKDVYNILGYAYVPDAHKPYYLISVSDYGSTKGLEFQLYKNTNDDNLETRLDYELAFQRGTSSSLGTSFAQGLDFYTGEYAIALTEYPTNNDVRHRVNWQFNLIWGEDEGPSIAGINFLEKFRFGLNVTWRSGYPYTIVNTQSKAISEINAARGPSMTSTSLRIMRTIYLHDIFGGNVDHSKSIDIYFDLSNILNDRSIATYYTTSGDPVDDGVTFYTTKGSLFPSRPYYEYASAGIPQSYDVTQYDHFGDRKYDVRADYDGNGQVTNDELYISWARQMETSLRFQGNFLAPRTATFGIMFNF